MRRRRYPCQVPEPTNSVMLQPDELTCRGHGWHQRKNWESEYLQMAVFVLLSTFLVQKGSPESRRPGPGDRVDGLARGVASTAMVAGIQTRARAMFPCGLSILRWCAHLRSRRLRGK
jgi:hypothetical protein